MDQKTSSGQEKWAAESGRTGTMSDRSRGTSSNSISSQKSGEIWRLWKIYEKLKFWEILHVKDTEELIQKLTKVDGKVKIFDIFDDFRQLQSNQSIFLFFWYTVNPQKHVGALFKKIRVKKFWPKRLNPPTINLRISIMVHNLWNRVRVHRPFSPLGHIGCFCNKIFILNNQTLSAFILK